MFFQDAKSSPTKYKKSFMEPVKHINWSFLQIQLTVYIRKQFLQKDSTLDVWKGPK